MGLKCGACHYQIFHTVLMREKKTMADIRKGLSYGAGYNGQRAFDVKTRCARCHIL